MFGLWKQTLNYVAKVGPKLKISLPQPPKCWDYGNESPHLACERPWFDPRTSQKVMVVAMAAAAVLVIPSRVCVYRHTHVHLYREHVEII